MNNHLSDINKSENVKFSYIKFATGLLVILFFATFIIRTATIKHGFPSNYVDDVLMKWEGFHLYNHWMQGTVRQQLTMKHAYALLGTEMVALWAGFKHSFLKNQEYISRLDFSESCRQLMLICSIIFILSCFFYHNNLTFRIVSCSTACVLLVPFLFGLMTRPHGLNLLWSSLILVFVSMQYHKQLNIIWIVLGFLCGLSASTIVFGFLNFWFCIVLFYYLKDFKNFIWYFVPFLVGLIPGYIDHIILMLQPSLSPPESFLGDITYHTLKEKVNYFTIGVGGILSLFRVLLGYELILAIGLILLLCSKKISTFHRICFYAMLPMLIFLLLFDLSPPRYYLPIYPILIFLSSAGWVCWMKKNNKTNLFFITIILASLVLQFRVAYLMNQDLRNEVEDKIFNIIPDSSILVVEAGGSRFINYPKKRAHFTIYNPLNDRKSELKYLKSNYQFIYYLDNSRNKNKDSFSKQMINSGRLINEWKIPGDEKSTQDLPNHLPFPVVDAWKRSKAGPNHKLWLVNTELINL